MILKISLSASSNYKILCKEVGEERDGEGPRARYTIVKSGEQWETRVADLKVLKASLSI